MLTFSLCSVSRFSTLLGFAKCWRNMGRSPRFLSWMPTWRRKYAVILVSDVAKLKHWIPVGRTFCLCIWYYDYHYAQGSGTSFRYAIRCVLSATERCGICVWIIRTSYPERGNRKKAIRHLQVRPLSKTYHFSSFSSGSWLGLALPAVAGGSYLCKFRNIF